MDDRDYDEDEGVHHTQVDADEVDGAHVDGARVDREEGGERRPDAYRGEEEGRGGRLHVELVFDVPVVPHVQPTHEARDPVPGEGWG